MKLHLQPIVCFVVFLVAFSAFAQVSTEELKTKATNGDADSAYLVGLFYKFGDGGEPRDDTEAIKWFKKAALAGHQEAEINIANYFESGIGLPKSILTALTIRTKLANEGEPLSQMTMARICLGLEPPYDFKFSPSESRIEAYKWLTLAGRIQIEALQMRGEVQKGMSYGEIMQGTSRARVFTPQKTSPLDVDKIIADINSAITNQAKARIASLVSWQQQKASNGVAYVQFDLGIRYLSGDGVESNHTVGLYWIKRAAAQSNDAALQFLNTTNK